MIHPNTVAYTQGLTGEAFDNLLYALRQAGFVLMRTEDLATADWPEGKGWPDRYTPTADSMQDH